MALEELCFVIYEKYLQINQFLFGHPPFTHLKSLKQLVKTDRSTKYLLDASVSLFIAK